MITRTAVSWHTEDWQKALSNSIRSLESLFEWLELPLDPQSRLRQAHAQFPVRVPRGYLEKIVKGDSKDPLLLQILPTQEELESHEGFVVDPLQERNSNPQQGLLHKYQNRVLLVLSGACGVNCRYCFRRHFPYSENQLSEDLLTRIHHYIDQRPQLNEVILSGGDPLLLSNVRLAKLLNLIESIPHVKRVRIHSRMPVVIPQRVDKGLLSLLAGSDLQRVLVTHINHPREMDGLFDQAMGALQEAGVTLLNQSVLLRGVNDQWPVLADLSERLFEAGVMPYYLHLLDPVAGAAHFDVTESEARDIMARLHRTLPGFLLPRLVREVADRPGKTPIDLNLS